MRATRGGSSATSARGVRRPQTRNQPPMYEDFTPLIENLEDESSHIILIHLPGFTKDQLKILAESNRRILRVRGERLLGNKLARFQHEIPVPQECQITKIRARFEHDILNITMPRTLPPPAAAAADHHPLPSPQPAVRPPPLPPPPPPPPPPQQLEEPQHVSSPDQQPSHLLPPLVRTPSPPPLKAPEPPQIPQSQSSPQLHPAADHDQYHDAPANLNPQEKQLVNEGEPKLSSGVPKPKPTDNDQHRQTTFGSSTTDQEEHHPIPQQTSHQPPSHHQENVYHTQLEQLLADSHLPKQSSGALNAAAGRGIIHRPDGSGAAAAALEEITTRRRHVQQHGVEDKLMKENGKAGGGGMLYGNGWKKMLMEERQLAVNAGVAILVAFSLGAYVSYSLLSSGKSNN